MFFIFRNKCNNISSGDQVGDLLTAALQATVPALIQIDMCLSALEKPNEAMNVCASFCSSVNCTQPTNRVVVCCATL